MTDLSDRLAALTPAQRALLDLRSRKRDLDLSRAVSEAAADPAAPIPRRRPAPSHPLSIDQERIFFIHSLNPESPFYNIYTVVRWHGSLDPGLLRRVYSEIVRRHEIFRTRFELIDGRPAQIVEPPFEVELPVIDLRGLPGAAAWAAADREVTGILKAPFALDRLPLLRFRLFRVREDELLWAVAFHHIITDWVSFHAFQSEVVLLYRAFSQGLPSPLPELPVQYADYAVWQRRQLTNEALAEQLTWWREQLREAPHVTELPVDHPRPAVQQGEGLRRDLALSREVSDAVRGLARREGVTLFIAFLALFKALIVRVAGQPRVIVGSPMVVREHPDLEPLLGFFLTQLVLYTDLSGDPGFLETLRRVRVSSLGAFSHKETPFGQVVEMVQPVRDLSRMPLTQLTFLFLNPQHFDVPRMPGVEMRPYRFDGESSKFDVTLALWDRPESFDGLLEYNSELFDRTTIDRFNRYFQTLAEAALADPGRPLSQLPLVSPAERHQVLVEWNDTAYVGTAAEDAAFRGACLHELFARQARRSPEAPAVSCGGRILTYRELDERSDELAAALRGLAAEEAVGLLVRRSVDMIVGLLGILKAGGAYLPLDPSHPDERLRYQLSDAGVHRLVTEGEVFAARREAFAGLEVRPLFLDETLPAAGPAAGPESLPGQLAYVLYTSGSTGRPKGVMVSHGAVVNLLASMVRCPGLGAGDRVLAVTTLTFDVASLEIHLSLVTGAHLVVADEATVRDGRALARRLEEARITWMQGTPAAWRLLLEGGATGTPGLQLISSGEALPRDLAERLLRCCDTLWDFYGPTETTIYSTGARVTSGAGPVSLGRPVAGTRIHLLDPDLRPVVRGAAGEVFIAGDGLARGYLHQPALTAERFLPDPFAREAGTPGGRIYRVGDLGRQRADGELEFLGRVDHQVKLRGFRIELGEIEAALAECPGIREAVVVLRDDALVAFVVPDASGSAAAEAPTEDIGPRLRGDLGRRLPVYMLPARFVVLGAMPRTPNGKLDRAALLRLETPGQAAAEDVSPRTPDQEILALIWCEVLGIEKVGIRDDFFARGGHSLLAMQVLSRIREIFRVDLPVRSLFTAPTIAGLARHLEAALRAGETSTIPALAPRPRDAGPLPLSFAQQRLWFLDRLIPGNAFYNLPSPVLLTGRLDTAALAAALAGIARRHEVLRTTFATIDGEPVQVVHPPADAVLPLIDLLGLLAIDEAAAQGEARRLALEEAAQPFDLEAGPLWRAALVRLRPEEHALLLDQHHSISDGWSLGVFLRELEALYGAALEGRAAALPALPVQYADFALWQRSWLQGDVLAAQLAWWRGQLGEEPPVLDLPADRPRPALPRFRGAVETLSLPADLSQALASLGRRHGATLAMTLLAGFHALLSRLTGEQRIAVGTPVAGRSAPELEGLIGFFVNTLVMVGDLAGDPAFPELLGRVRETALEAYVHQDLPFEKLVEELELERDLSRNPLFQVVFALQNAPLAPPRLPGLRLEPLRVEAHTTRFDLELHVWETPEGLAGAAAYDTDLFDAATIRRMLDGFAALLAEVVARPETRLGELPWLGTAGRREVRRPARRARPAAAPRVAPRTPLEESLAAIWEEVLGLPEVGAGDDFFFLGGHSLLAMRVLARVRDFLGVDLPVRALFEAPTVAGLARHLEVALRADETTAIPPLRPRDRDAGPPLLSFSQQRLWFLDRLAPGNTFHNMPYVVRLVGRLDAAALAGALGEIVRRHEVLRTTFAARDGEAVQVIHPPHPPASGGLPLVDLASLDGLDGRRAQAEARRLAEAEAARPFDLGAGPLWRGSLVRLGTDEHVLLANQHHIVFDGWSIGVFQRELEALYGACLERRPSPLPDLPIQYADFALWQRQWLQGEVLEAQLRYWRQQLGDEPPVLHLPTDRPRSAVQMFRGAVRPVSLPADLVRDLRSLGRHHGATLAMTLLAGFYTLLHRTTGQERIPVGSPVAGRPSSDLEQLVGFFVNSLVMVGEMGGDPAFAELLGRVREMALEAYAHQDLPFEKLVEELDLERDLSRNPLFQVAFALQNIPLTAPQLPGLRLEPLGFAVRTTRFDLELHLWETPEGLAGLVSYDTDLFDGTTIERQLGRLGNLLAGAAARPGASLRELPWLGAAESHQVLAEWSRGESSAPARPVHERVAAQAVARPDAVAVSMGPACLTYGELQRRAALLARRLRGLGVGPETVVAVLTGRSLEYPIASLAVLAAGGAYLPLDLSSPPMRLAAMLEDAGVRAVLVGAGRQPLAEELAAGGRRLLVSVDPGEARAGETGPGEVRPLLAPGQPAYVIYTSGSTGLPKGVVVTHRTLANLAAWHIETHGVSPMDRATLTAAVGFDASVWELWPALSAGASLHIPGDDLYGSPAGLLAWLAAQNITLGFLPTPLMQLALREELPADLRPRALFAGGDALQPPGRALPFPLIDLYGPTEGTVVTTRAALPPGELLEPNIGRPVANVRVHVVDGAFGPSPIGVPGELLLGGAGLARGYLGQPALTAERFVPDPWGESPGGRLYRSGDAARFLSDGRLEFLGRLDHQVKLRGFRIETGEIEAALRQHPAVRQAVVVACGDLPGARESRRGERRLAAYVVPETPETTAADAPAAEEGLAAEQVAQWQSVFDDYVYGELADETGDATLNIAGWRSSYTGASLGAAAMREWLEDRVERILCREPRRVLEIGCGTGMMLFAIAPRCEAYWGTDFSRTSLEYVRQQLAEPERRLPGVRLLERRADDWSGLAPRSFDAVVLNSVVQYFPGPEYLLAVLEQAVEAVAPGGFVFVGDVRSLPLLEAFHASLELFRAEPSASRRELARRVRRAVARDKELALDPALFPALRERWPRLAAVEIQLPSGRHANELSRFRYDVVLHVGDGEVRPPAPPPDLRWLDWRREGLGARELRRLLAEQAPPALGLLGVPNARVRGEARLLAWLAGEDRPETAGDFRRRQHEEKNEEAGAVDPDALRALAAELGYEAGIAWSPPEAGAGPSGLGSCDVLLARPGAAGTTSPGTLLPLAAGAPPSPDRRPLASYANHPLWGRFAERLVPSLRSFLRERLPEPMVPAAFVVLEELPLTPRGKIDRRALPAPEETRPEVRTAARTPVEERLAAIWKEVLDLPGVGIEDDFFALGGHSLLAMRALSRIRDVFRVELPVRAFFESPVIADLARRLEREIAAGAGVAAAPPLVRLPRDAGDGEAPRFPLSFAQQRLWILDRLMAGSAPYNILAPLRLKGRLDLPALAGALREIARRHEMLRTTFAAVDGEPVQVIHPTPPSGPLVVDLQGLGPAERHGEAQRLVGAEAARPFDLTAGPLWRTVLLRLAPLDQVLLVNQHHIASDGWSLGVFFGELEALYAAALEGLPSPLPELPVQYADYAVWQRRWLAGDVLAAQLAFWRQRLGDGLPLLRLPTDRPRPAVQSFRGAVLRVDVPPDLAASLRALGQREEATLAMTLLAAFHTLLFRMTGQEGLVVGTPVAGRPEKRLEGLLGFFVNSLVLVGDAAGNPPWRELLGRVRAMSLEAYAHQDLPFDKLVEELALERDLSRNPLFQVLFALQNVPAIRLRLPGVTPEPFAYEMGSTRFDLELHLWDQPGGLSGFCSYATDLFDATTIARLSGHFQTLLRSLGEHPEARLSDLAWLAEAERHQLLVEWDAETRVLDAFGQVSPIGVWGGVRSTGERGRRLRDGALQLDAATLRRLELPGGPVELWRVEEALLAAPQVEDCAVLVRETESGERLLVAYVVSAMPATSERLARDLAPGMRPAAFVPVAALPLTPEGGLDREALLALEVLDGDLVERWERSLAALPEVEHAAVVVRESAPAPALLHLLDLLPERGRLEMESGGGPRGRRTPTADEVPSRPPALARGGALEIPEDAPRTLTEALLRTARDHPGRGIVHVRADGSEHFQSYPALLAAARSVLTGLRRAGLRPGDRLILQVPRPEDHFTGFWAAVLGGITPVTVAVPPSYEERVAVVNKLYNTWKLLGRPAVLTSEGLREPLGGLAHRLGEEAPMTVLSVDELAACPPAEEIHPAGEDDLVFLQLTSGSTGIPKCIQERHRGVVAHIHGSRQYNGLGPDDVILNWLPMDHVVPTLTYHLKDVYLGCQEIQIPPALVLAAPLLWLDRMEAHRVTHTWSPNFGFKLVSEQLAQNPGRRWDLSSLRFAMNAGEQVTMAVVREFLERVAPFGVSEQVMQPAYGMAEVCTAMTYCSDFSVATGSRRFRKSTLNSLLEPAGSGASEAAVDFIDVGPPIPGVDVRIVDHQNRLLPEGVIGRLQIQGEVVTPGYLANEEANREAFPGDGWFNTGDLGFLLDGRLSITGREKEIIIVRGANFYCYEIEDVVNGVEGVEPTFSGACGLADPRSGTEELAVFFVPAGAQEELRVDRRTVEAVERVRAAVTASLGISPRRVVPMTAAEFPKTTSGKIQRTQLKSWLEEGRFTTVLRQLDLLEENANTLPDWFHRKVWRRREGLPERLEVRGTALVFTGAAGPGSAVAAGLARAGQPVIQVEPQVEPGAAWERLGPDRFRIDPADPEHYRRLLSEVRQELGEVGRVVHLWTWGDPTGTEGIEELRRAQTLGAVSLLLLVQALERDRSGSEHRVQLLAVSSRSQPVLPDDLPVYGRGTLPPLVKTAPQELPWLDACHLDLPADEVEEAGARVLHELAVVSGEREVAWRQGRRLVARLARIEPRAARTRQTPFRRGGRYLITGGAGGLGAEVARHLLETCGAHLLLTGRSPEAGPVLGRLQVLGDCAYEPVDVCDAQALEDAVRRAEERWGAPLDGALHLAGAYHERLLTEETAESFGEVLRPKVEGAWVLRELLRRRPGSLFVTFSSVNSFFGGFRVGAYAAANGFLECLAHAPGEDGPRSRCLAWSLWDERGISRGRAMQQPAAARGFRAVALGQGLVSLEIALRLDEPAVLVGLMSERANVRRLLDAPDRRAQQAEVFLTLRSAAPAVRTPRIDMTDGFGTPVRGELRILAEMPLAHGRPDRRQLLLLDRSLGPEPVAPRNEMERRLLALWQEVLEAPRFGVEDNFFRFGGHSLLALRLVARIQQELGVEAPLATLFAAPTVARMARLFTGEAEASPAWSAVVPIQPEGDRPPFFCVAPIMGTVFPYFELARHLGTDQPFYGLQPPALTPDAPPLTRIEDIAAFFVDALRSVQPSGPWYLGGWSFGTLVAHEMARQLEERGEEVRLVAHFDAPAPVRSQRLTPVRALRTFYDVVLRNFWPYVRDYFYLKTLPERETEKENGHSPSGLARFLRRLRSLESLRSLVEGAAIASVVPRESRLVMFHPPEIRAMLRTLRENSRAMSSYKPEPYAGQVTLFRTGDPANGHKDPALGWGEIAQGVEVRWIPGNHMTLLRSPHVEVFAQSLRESLEASQGR